MWNNSNTSFRGNLAWMLKQHQPVAIFCGWIILKYFSITQCQANGNRIILQQRHDCSSNALLILTYHQAGIVFETGEYVWALPTIRKPSSELVEQKRQCTFQSCIDSWQSLRAAFFLCCSSNESTRLFCPAHTERWAIAIWGPKRMGWYKYTKRTKSNPMAHV